MILQTYKKQANFIKSKDKEKGGNGTKKVLNV